MIDPTTPNQLHDLPAWSDTDSTDPAFARRAAEYLDGHGLGPDAIAVALEAELGLCRSDAVALSGGRRTSPLSASGWPSPRRGHGPAIASTQNHQLVSH